MPKIYKYLSPNFNDRPSDKELDLIVIHYTSMQLVNEALTRLCDPTAAVSSHYLIESNGTLHHLVDDTKRAWHAGVSFWQGERDINGISIGIELDNGGHDFDLPFYPACQIEALLSLLTDLVQKYHIPKERIIGHSDIAPTRKRDPGEHFPWQLLHNHGFGLWPETDSVRHAPQSVLEVQQCLTAIGYDCPLTDILDAQTSSVIEAFQRHFTPMEITGTITPQLKFNLSCFHT
ncbi:N-acetylmuramoyl-L-alanine amidase [Candidatus Paracaedibacter symbiosus]|uniref:N-acetylmuramoyl-L-alanine amidase n=1 Tax=Candidatus Paracaedibacter symbiosus TaxID=244582 RepID=UPI000509A1FA|nr:N-acetylmuramoyl-L-alanine amidase [Candidatus Paracaedibacter symbiosus]